MAGYLRVEGVNFDASILDTADLSTIRGSSLLFLNIIKELNTALQANYGAKQVSLGASTGLWRFDNGDPETVATEVRNWLNGTSTPARSTPAGSTPALPHAPLAVFTVVATADSGDFLTDRETLLAKARLQQMRLPAVVYPGSGREVILPPDRHQLTDPDQEKTETWVCELDMVRPRATNAERIKGEWKWVSPSVRERRKYGVEAKQHYYREVMDAAGISLNTDILPSHETFPFARHFESLTEPARTDPSKDKIAVLYIDGNKFSEQERAYVSGVAGDKGKTPIERQQEYDTQIQTFRAKYLKRLLEMLHEEGGHGAPATGEKAEREALQKKYPYINTDRVIRMETLFWGGDDLMIILPARLGWRAVQELHELTQNYRGNGQWKIGDLEMHHAAGLIYCHHNAPIHRIKQLADSLCRNAKGKKQEHRETSRLAYMVLESFDLTGGDTNNYWHQRTCNNFTMDNFIIEFKDLQKVKQMIAALKKDDFGNRPYPNRRVRNLASAIHRADQEYVPDMKAILDLTHQEKPADELMKRLEKARSAAWLDFPDGVDEALNQGFGDDKPLGARWLIIEDLWDYLALGSG